MVSVMDLSRHFVTCHTRHSEIDHNGVGRGSVKSSNSGVTVFGLKDFVVENRERITNEPANQDVVVDD